MRITYDNLVDYGTISAPTAYTNNPATNMQDERLTTKYKTSTLSGVISVDLGSIQTTKVVAILGHNFTSSATISYTDNTGTYALTMLDTILRFTATGESLDMITESGNYLITESSDQLITDATPATRYGYFTYADASNPDGYIEIGRLWMGDYIDINPSSLNDFTVTKKRSDVVAFGRDRQKFANPGVGWRRMELSFPKSNEAMVSQISDMYDNVGTHKALIFCNFDLIRDYVLVEPCYCVIDGELTFSHSDRMKFSYSLNLEEVL